MQKEFSMKYSNYNHFDFKLENLENYLSESLLMVQRNIKDNGGETDSVNL